MAASTTFRGFAGIMGVDRDRVQAEALLTAGLEAAAAFVDSLGEAPLTNSETAITLGTGTVRAFISDETGRIDIGQTPVEVLAALLQSVGAPDGLANALAQSIDQLRKAGNAGSGNAAPAGNQSAAKPGADRPFTDVRQLALVPGMAPEWIAAMTPLVTVFGTAAVNPLTAPAGVIAALPGVDSGRLQAFLATRQGAPADPAKLIASLGPAGRFLDANPQRVPSVELSARLSDGYAAAAHAVIVQLPQDSQPYRVLLWNPRPAR